MTLADVLLTSRNRYNSVNDSFYSDMELIQYVYDACLDLARKCFLIERLYTTSTVVGQQSYNYPTGTMAIKRITFAGKKLKPITMREDDSITGLNQSTLSQGTPQYYFIWNQAIYLRHIPSSIDTLEIWSINEPAPLTSTSVLEIPTIFHMDLVNYVLSMMSAKDKDYEAAEMYLQRWQHNIKSAMKWYRRKNRGDSFSVVQDEDMMVEGYLGIV